MGHPTQSSDPNPKNPPLHTLPDISTARHKLKSCSVLQVGCFVGPSEGCFVGCGVGFSEGCFVGCSVGSIDGAIEGTSVEFSVRIGTAARTFPAVSSFFRSLPSRIPSRITNMNSKKNGRMTSNLLLFFTCELDIPPTGKPICSSLFVEKESPCSLTARGLAVGLTISVLNSSPSFLTFMNEPSYISSLASVPANLSLPTPPKDPLS
mmetsp:Transcript_3891/g.5990  ORF Transcript_3891/g.5990 Transcript_3891/m.5990 type:complete len:207 (+) Transcript_3891:613-1233(+)